MPNARARLVSLPILLLVAMAGSPGCLATGDTTRAEEVRSGADPLATLSSVASIAAREPTLARRWVRASTPLARGPLPTIASPFPGTARAPVRVAIDGLPDVSVTLTPRDAAAAPATLVEDRAVYPDAHPSTDVVQLRDGTFAESLYVLRDEAAPATFSWTLARGASIVATRSDHDGGLAFVDARGRARLWIERPFAVDARGVRREATLDLTGDVITVSLDRAGLAYPIVLDPYVGTSHWSLVPVDPTPRHGCSVAAAGSKLALFGGKNGLRLDDTWTWDGAAWAHVTNASHPSARVVASMATLGTKTILFGGVDENGAPLRDTWAFDGAAWTKLSPAHSPPARAFAPMATLGSRVVLFGGEDAPHSELSDTWTFDGTDWTEIKTADAPAIDTSQLGTAMASVGGVLYLVAVDSGDTWTFDGAAWTDRSASASTPKPGSSNDGIVGLGVAGGQLVLATTYGTFALQAGAWKRVATAHAPPWRSDGCGASFGGALAIFGGSSQGGDLHDFWIFDGADWTQPVPRSAPSPRANARLAALDGKVVLFGGVDANGTYALDDTWELDGARWSASSATGPADAPQAVMANAGAGVVLFDGTDTWTWDHHAWTAKSTTHQPGSYRYGVMARVGTDDVLVTTSDVAADVQTIETWIWNGTDWKEASGAGGPDLFGTFTSLGGAGIFLDPAAPAQWTWSGTGWSAATDAPPFGKNQFLSFPSGQSAAVDVGKYALFLGDAPGWTANRAWIWDGKRFGQLAIEGLPLRNETSAVSTGGKVYVFGGGDSSGALHSDTYALDVAYSNGEACGADAECDSAICAQGVCCNARCDGTTAACDLEGTKGTCAPRLAACVDLVTVRGADGTTKSCAPYLCNAGTCPTTCTTSADCAGGYLCDVSSHACVAASLGASSSSGGCAVEGHGAGGALAAFGAGLSLLAAIARRRRA
jgi:hypothetical protein